MNFGLISIALIFISLAILLLGKGAADENKRRSEARLDTALTSSLDPLRVQKDPLKRKFMPQWVTDNLISAGLQINRELGLKFLAGVVLPTLGALAYKGAVSAVGAFILILMAIVLYVFYKQRKRRQLMLSQLPNFLDGVVRVSAVGYSLTVL